MGKMSIVKKKAAATNQSQPFFRQAQYVSNKQNHTPPMPKHHTR